jgi:hypothetical protein
MSKEQKLALDAVLSQGGLDLQADVPPLRASFNELMARIPVPDRARPLSAGSAPSRSPFAEPTPTPTA